MDVWVSIIFNQTRFKRKLDECWDITSSQAKESSGKGKEGPLHKGSCQLLIKNIQVPTDARKQESYDSWVAGEETMALMLTQHTKDLSSIPLTLPARLSQQPFTVLKQKDLPSNSFYNNRKDCLFVLITQSVLVCSEGQVTHVNFKGHQTANMFCVQDYVETEETKDTFVLEIFLEAQNLSSPFCYIKFFLK